MAAGRIALSYYRKDPSAKRKRDGTWVTEADRAVEAHIREGLAHAFPGHNVFGEEEGLKRADAGPPLEGAPTWIVDPIDATNNYIAGIPIWGTLIALRVQDRSLLGVCHAPALGETYDAAIGAGARCNDSTIHVDPVPALDAATVVFGGDKYFHEYGLAHWRDELVTRSWRTRGFGDFWGHMLVARGAAHVMVDPIVSLWDIAALEPIVAEANGQMTGMDGRPWSEGACITTNRTLHPAVMALVPDNG